MNRFAIIIALVLVGSIGILPAAGQENGFPIVPSDPKVLYTFMVDHYIECKLTICRGLDSRLPKMRKEAAMALDKINFCYNHRDELISALIEKQVEPKPYKVELFINRMYYKSQQ